MHISGILIPRGSEVLQQGWVFWFGSPEMVLGPALENIRHPSWVSAPESLVESGRGGEEAAC